MIDLPPPLSDVAAAAHQPRSRESFERVAVVLHDEITDHPRNTEWIDGPNGYRYGTCRCDMTPYMDAAAALLGTAGRLLAEQNRVPVYGPDDPDDGHTFFLAARSQMSSRVVGENHNSDSSMLDDRPFTLAVRASSLPDALTRLARAPLADWARDGVLLRTDEPVAPRAPIVHEVINDGSPPFAERHREPPAMKTPPAVCQVAGYGRELLTCPARESGGYQCERLDEHGDDEHAVGEHTKDHDRIGNGYACDLATPMIFGSDPANGPCL